MCSDVMHASHGTCMQASWSPYVYMACQKLLMEVLFTPAELVNPNRDSPNGYPTVTREELQPVTLAH